MSASLSISRKARALRLTEYARALAEDGYDPFAPRVSEEEKARAIMAEGGFDWASGETINLKPDAGEAAENERRMAGRYRRWAAANLVTSTPSTFESAFRHYKDMPFETINPIDDTVRLPPPHWDEKQNKWVVPKNVFDKNVISRRRFLFEIDGMALADQRVLLEPLLQARVIQRVVYSGNKSLHCVIEETDEPDASMDDETYKWAWRWMALKYFGDTRFADYSLPMKIHHEKPEVVDNRCGHPSRTTRSPFAIRKDEATGGKPVEQKLLYFEAVRTDSGWRAVYNREQAREKANQERMRRQAEQRARQNRDRGVKIPNAAALRFIGGDMSDGWKHASLGSAVASLKACGFSREQVQEVFNKYKKELQLFALHAYDYFEKKDRR